MGVDMNTLTQKVNVFNNAIMNNGRTFTSTVAPIKNAGNALNQFSLQQKSLTSQLASVGSAFKNNALAIGAAASSVLGLYQNYANLSSAQNNANKAATAAKAANNNLAKAQDNLAKTIAKYGANSKEAQAAQNKLTVAQERAVNKTESAKIAQDNLNQTMADFGINVLPNVILAGGSIVSIFDNINLKGKGLRGIISTLGGAFSSLIPSLGGIGSKSGAAAKGLEGVGTASKTATGGFSGLQGALGAGLVLGGAALIIQQVQAVQDAFDAAGIKFTKMKAGMLFSPTELQLSFEQFDELAHATGMSAIQMGEDMEGAKKKFVEAGGALDKAGNIIWGSFNKAQAAAAKAKEAIDKMPPSMNAAATSGNAMVNAIIVLRTQMEKHQITTTQYIDALAKLKIPGDQFIAIMDEVNVRMKANAPLVTTATKNMQGFGVSSGEVFDAIKILAPGMIAITKNTTELSDALVAGWQEVQKADPIFQGFGDTAENLAKKFGALNESTKIKFPSTDVQLYDNALAAWGRYRSRYNR